MEPAKTYQQLATENEQLRIQLEEATDTIQAIRSGQVDALVVQGEQGHELYTLKTADQTYRVFIETMHEGAVTVNEQGLILYGNSTFAAMVDQPLSSVIGTTFESLVDEESQAIYDNFFRQSWESFSKVELMIRQRSVRVPCLLSATPLALDEGPCLSIILTDLTTQKQTQQLLKAANEQLAQTNAELGMSNHALNRLNENLQQFAYIASHDLQEPLRKIQQFGNLLAMHYASVLDEQGQQFVERMASSASRMSTLLRDLLTYSRLTVPTETFQVQDLNQIVAEAISALELMIDETGTRITVSDLGQVPADSMQLGQVFQNLLSNSLKFAQSGVSPVIQLSRQTVARHELPPDYQPPGHQNHFCLIQVADNGIGFSAQYSERIFGAFQRLHGKNTYPGTGIGLAIVKKVIENHQGYIKADSAPNQGATFSIYLPTN
ncbi:sensor histidine kinase [Tellurirhabdus bombi]|uniref:sensor histidine kinase n=1 Tax=Tellurirhabdus bombi TaxID=2907205 RepID=UPI001F40295B|nr:ATP-binding protein [Tellurirhabdus bombi]